MKASKLSIAVLSVRRPRLSTTLAATAVTVILLLGASSAPAQTVDRDGDNAIAIRDLEIGSLVYDVNFCSRSTPAT
jgi:hypothetical protein